MKTWHETPVGYRTVELRASDPEYDETVKAAIAGTMTEDGYRAVAVSHTLTHTDVVTVITYGRLMADPCASFGPSDDGQSYLKRTKT